MKLLAVTLALLALIAFTSAFGDISQQPRDVFDEWLNTFPDVAFNSKYEEIRRFQIFKQNLKIIHELQSQTNETKFGLTRFAHLTPEEFAATYLSAGVPFVRDETSNEFEPIPEAQLKDVPESVDWTSHNPPVVTPVKDQGQCGSCWAFSTTGNVEGQWALAGKGLVSLSEQQLVDCDHTCIDGVCDSGCNGGLMANAFTYAIKNGGIDTDASYPYQGRDGSCRTGTIGAKISSYKFAPQNTEQIQAFLAKTGPLAVAVDATTFQFYRGGILTGSCGTRLNHGVLLVGYGTDNGTDFWKIKNSWGGSWGENGYIRIQRTKNYCGVEEYVVSSAV